MVEEEAQYQIDQRNHSKEHFAILDILVNQIDVGFLA